MSDQIGGHSIQIIWKPQGIGGHSLQTLWRYEKIGGHSLQTLWYWEGIGGHSLQTLYRCVEGVHPVSFNEERFPTDISFGAMGGPGYEVSITTTAGGHEKRSLIRNDGFMTYDVSHNVKTRTQFNTLLAWYRAHKGRAIGFRFKDWQDYQLEDEVIATGDGETVEFQAIKTYTIGDYSDVRNIYKIVADTVTVKVDGVAQEEGVDFTLNYNTGKITFTTAPAQDKEISLTCEFDVPVRFDMDRMEASIEGPEIYEWSNIILKEIKDIS